MAEGDVGALRREGAGDRRAYAAASPSDDGFSAFEFA
jgi:hypothetical protein